MRLWMKQTDTSSKRSMGIRLACLCLVASWNGCTANPPVSVVIPDSRDLREAYTCDHEAKVCQHDPTGVTIDLGYLRAIIEQLDACRKQTI